MLAFAAPSTTPRYYDLHILHVFTNPPVRCFREALTWLTVRSAATVLLMHL